MREEFTILSVSFTLFLAYCLLLCVPFPAGLATVQNVPDAAANLDSAVPEDLRPARRTSPAERLGAVAEVVLCSGFPTQLFLVTVMTAAGMQFMTPEGHWSPIFVSVLSLLDTALVIGLVVLFLSSHGERPRDVLIGPRDPWREAVVGLGLLPIVFVLAVLILAVLYVAAPQLHNSRGTRSRHAPEPARRGDVRRRGHHRRRRPRRDSARVHPAPFSAVPGRQRSRDRRLQHGVRPGAHRPGVGRGDCRGVARRHLGIRFTRSGAA